MFHQPVSSSPWQSCFQCLILAVSYVAAIYIFDKRIYDRNHPESIKQRIKSVTLICLLAPVFVYYCGSTSFTSRYDVITWLGLHTNHIINAIFFPLLLTAILFLGPIVMRLCENGIDELQISILSFNDLRWCRDYVVAPLTEEFIFRACMLPIMTSAFGLTPSIFLTPLFFGVAHVHHAVEHIKNGNALMDVVFSTVFQLSYTTLFGAYCCFIFLRTGHFIAPVLCHSFCNMMGFPDFPGISTSRSPNLITISFCFGLLLFLFLLFPMTTPSLYESIYWNWCDTWIYFLIQT